MLTAGLDAQVVRTTQETNVKIENGKDMKVIGCLHRSADHKGYVLSNLSGDAATHRNFVLLAEAEEMDDLAEHVGHKVELQGDLVDRDHGEVEIKTKTAREVAGGDDSKSEVKTEIKGEHAGSPFLGVESVKMISKVCP
jgi:hypothetical protein